MPVFHTVRASYLYFVSASLLSHHLRSPAHLTLHQWQGTGMPPYHTACALRASPHHPETPSQTRQDCHASPSHSLC